MTIYLLSSALLHIACLKRAQRQETELGGGFRKGWHMLMKACAGSGEGRCNVSLGAHGVSTERSLERIGDDGASQAG